MVTETFSAVQQSSRSFLLTTLSANVLSQISYTAVRGQSEEVGAVQRILTTRRIKSLKEFTLAGGDFPGSIVLNWVGDDLQKGDGTLSFNLGSKMAQIIDGQHRMAGIKEAIREKAQIGEMRIPVVIYERLSTKECADIFLAINTEQKPAPRSLVFDLYGVGSEVTIDAAASRARDIAEVLNSELESPYHGQVKFPGEKKRKGGIALSTIVSAIKPLVEPNAPFDQIGVSELVLQIKCITNYFNVLRSQYGDDWYLSSNAFNYAAGFTAACEFLMLKIIPYCNTKGSFEEITINDALKLRDNGLIKQEEVSGLGGKEAAKLLFNRLDASFVPDQANAALRF